MVDSLKKLEVLITCYEKFIANCSDPDILDKARVLLEDSRLRYDSLRRSVYLKMEKRTLLLLSPYSNQTI